MRQLLPQIRDRIDNRAGSCTCTLLQAEERQARDEYEQTVLFDKEKTMVNEWNICCAC
jgi:hypothetical protein